MNTFVKFAPNVFVAACENRHEKGQEIILTTKYGKEVECEVWNFLGQSRDGKFLYSITRNDGMNSQERAKKRLERLQGAEMNALKRYESWREKSNEGRDFLVLAEPIKIGHHSENRHRALIERNWKRMGNAMNELSKAEEYQQRQSYWEAKAEKIDLSMPESVEYFEFKLAEAQIEHEGLKDGTIPRDHSFSLTYAKKRVNEMAKNLELAKRLWA
jgi:hypothetical protein